MPGPAAADAELAPSAVTAHAPISAAVALSRSRVRLRDIRVVPFGGRELATILLRADRDRQPSLVCRSLHPAPMLTPSPARVDGHGRTHRTNACTLPDST